MRTLGMAAVLLALAAAAAVPALADHRADAIWARNTGSTVLTLDGSLNEAPWARAESLQVTFGIDAGIPGSGWKLEAGLATPNDSLKATLKFLVSGDYLWLGAKIKDRFIGGSKNWERFDGLLMALKDHADPNAPKPPAEYFYSWWFPEGQDDPQPPGQMPAFAGRWAEWPPGSERTPEQIAAWDARTVVQGTTNSDAAFDTGYTVEMRFKLSVMGYDVLRPEGDILEWNISLYDCDGYWPLDGQYFCSNRVWVQSPWGNAAWYNELRIWTRPDVTWFSPTLPEIDPEVHVLNGAALATPTIDGQLNEPSWNSAWPRFDIRYGDDVLRQTYPYVGRWLSGQYQPTVNGGQAAVLDPADASVRMFYKGTTLYLGMDVRDQVVQYHPNFDRWDGFIITINDRVERNPDNALLGRRLAFQIGPAGQAIASDFLLTMVQAGDAQVATALRPGTTVDTLGLEPDVGYTAEVALDLTALGYDASLGDRALFIGVNLLDGDSFLPVSDSYGTRTWWYRQYEGECCPAWAYLNPNFTSGAEDEPVAGETELLLRNYPNPGSRTTIAYSLAEPGAALLEVYDVQGRLVERRPLGLQPAGDGRIEFDGSDRPAGIYLYRLQVTDPASGAVRSTRGGRMIIVN